ncbi:MAG: hypothetical protein KDB61_05035 [Planctomycetes bacterium]|nr:hypothetical protein [Planctomycetota bacterium]
MEAGQGAAHSSSAEPEEASHRSLGLAQTWAEGNITGWDGYNKTASWFEINTGAGDFRRTLTKDMTKQDLFMDLADEMARSGLTVWLDTDDDDDPRIIVLLDDSVAGIGSSTTDDGLSAVTQVSVPE